MVLLFRFNCDFCNREIEIFARILTLRKIGAIFFLQIVRNVFRNPTLERSERYLSSQTLEMGDKLDLSPAEGEVHVH